MDDDGLNIRNWGYYETPSYKAQLNLQLMTNMADRDTKHFLPGRDPSIMVGNHGALHPRDCMVSDASIPMNYMREGWMGQREFLNMLPMNPLYPMLPETSGAHSLHILQPPNSSRDERVPKLDERVPRIDEKPALIDDRSAGIEESSVKKRVQSKKHQGGGASKIPKPKKARKPKENDGNAAPRTKPAKKSLNGVINGIDMDISGITVPVCSCTGTPQQCYRWGCGGWQSACCTTNVSVYPLPMSTKRRGARIAGRKMSQGAFKKVLEKLAAEGYNFGNPIDLRTHWARHGTNKFVTIR